MNEDGESTERAKGEGAVGAEQATRGREGQEANALFALVHNSPSGMHFYELTADDRLVFRGANPAADRILGLDNTRFVGKTIDEAFPVMGGTEVPARYREAAANGTPWSTEQVDYHDNEISGAFEVHAFQTSPGRMVAVFSDITERKLMQLRSEAQRDLGTALGATDDLHEALRLCLRAAIQHSGADSGGIYVADAAGALDLEVHEGLSEVFVQAVKHFGPETREAQAVRTGRAVYDVPEVRSGIIAQRVRQERLGSAAAIPILHRGEVVACMNVAAKAPGRFSTASRQWLEAIGVQISGAIARLRSLEYRRSLEAQLQQAMKMEAIGRLAGAVAHDFNNLLTAIAGNVSMALLASPSQDQHEMLKASMRAVDSAAALTRQLLAFSRKQMIVPRPIELNAVIGSLEGMLGRLLGASVSLSTRPCEGTCPVVADRGQLEQILVNLVVNARDAMPEGGRLTIGTAVVELDETACRAHAGVKPGRYGKFSVSDTGTGMTDEVLQHLFEPFFTTKPVGRGTGLGLATTYGAVKQSGGFVQVHTELGRGTSVSVHLPLAEVPEAADQADDLRADAAVPAGTETILLVEDEPLVLRVAQESLRRLGYRVLSAACAAEGLARASEHPGVIHLLLTDVVMPGMDGPQLAGALRALRPELRVLFVSGYPEDFLARRATPEPQPDLLPKPFTAYSLAAKVRQVLDR